jgi:hypothetical protein
MFGVESDAGLTVTVGEYAEELTARGVHPGFYYAPDGTTLISQSQLAHVLVMSGASVQAHPGAGGNVFLVLDGGSLQPPLDRDKPITIVRSEKADAPEPSGKSSELYLKYPAIFPCPVPELYSDMFLLLLRERRQ